MAPQTHLEAVTQPFVDCKFDTLHLHWKQLCRREMLLHSKFLLFCSQPQLSPETHVSQNIPPLKETAQ